MQIKRYFILPLLACFGYLTAKTQANDRLVPGRVIRQSMSLQRDLYSLEAPADNHQPLIRISGKNIELDGNQLILNGTLDPTRPDEMKGLAIFIEPGSDHITIKNFCVRGYKIAILADSVSNLTILNCDLSYNRRPKLHSNLDREDVSDWLSFHKNDHGEWLRYGAAIYLNHCKDALIKNNLVTGGQCALLMTDCHHASVYDNNFSFNSGLGIGLYRSSDNMIYHNQLDFNVRGFSLGKYRRGQDSAGILVFEQSSENVFAYNSATHSGDGFFLWAGETTMNSGKGGCNYNLIYGNDFSYAPTNGVELTFSSNSVLRNRIWGCDHGIWGGYSYDSDFSDNVFAHNRIGIAIEHGQNMNIAMNEFNSNGTSIKLWSRAKQPEDWQYAKLKNTDSRNYWIASNRFMNEGTIYDIMGTDTVVFSGNRKSNFQLDYKIGDRVNELDTSRDNEPLDLDYQKDKRLSPIHYDKIPDQPFPQGCENIRITEWGPYDFNYPMIWLKEIDSNQLYHFDLLGPAGTWSLAGTSGFRIKHQGGDHFPSEIIAEVDSTIIDRNIRLLYAGPAYKDRFGKLQSSLSSHPLDFHEFAPLNSWQVKWYAWDSLSDPNKDYAAFLKQLQKESVKQETSRKIDYTWWGKIGPNLPADSFATVATTMMDLPRGKYEISITADDLVRFMIDGKEWINAWDAKALEYDDYSHHSIQVELEGRHEFKIIHADNQGLATLQFYLQPIRQLPEDGK